MNVKIPYLAVSQLHELLRKLPSPRDYPHDEVRVSVNSPVDPNAMTMERQREYLQRGYVFEPDIVKLRKMTLVDGRTEWCLKVELDG